LAAGLQRDHAEMMQAFDVVGLGGENMAVELLRLRELARPMTSQRLSKSLIGGRDRAIGGVDFVGHKFFLLLQPNPSPPFTISEVTAAG
jgi:hypothetical protein